MQKIAYRKIQKILNWENIRIWNKKSFVGTQEDAVGKIADKWEMREYQILNAGKEWK